MRPLLGSIIVDEDTYLVPGDRASAVTFYEGETVYTLMDTKEGMNITEYQVIPEGRIDKRYPADVDLSGPRQAPASYFQGRTACTHAADYKSTASRHVNAHRLHIAHDQLHRGKTACRNFRNKAMHIAKCGALAP